MINVSALIAALIVLAAAITYVNWGGEAVVDKYATIYGVERTWWSNRYALNIATIVLFFLFYWRLQGSSDLFLSLPLVVCGPVLGTVDAMTHRLPGIVTTIFSVIAVIAVIGAAAVDNDPASLVKAVTVAVFAGILFLLGNFVRGGVGMGDVKLAPAVFGLAAAVSWHNLLLMVFVSLIGAGLWALALMATKRATGATAIALGPWMLIGLAVSLLISQ